MNLINVSLPKKESSESFCKLSCSVDWLGTQKTLWLDYPKEFDNNLDNKCIDWVALSLLMPAMLSKSDLKISGNISSCLYLFLCSDIQHVLNLYNPKLYR